MPPSPSFSRLGRSLAWPLSTLPCCAWVLLCLPLLVSDVKACLDGLGIYHSIIEEATSPPLSLFSLFISLVSCHSALRCPPLSSLFPSNILVPSQPRLSSTIHSRPHHDQLELPDSPSMKETPTSSDSYINRIRSWATSKANGNSSLSNDTSRPTLPLANQDIINNDKSTTSTSHNASHNHPAPSLRAPNNDKHQVVSATANHVADETSSDHPPPAPPPQADGEGAVVEPEKPQRKSVGVRFYITVRSILLSSYINIFLVLVPVAIASKVAGLKPSIVFALNAIAIIPLAGLLSHATESVAKRMGDTIGALMNVTFGNAVELIILYVVPPPS